MREQEVLKALSQWLEPLLAARSTPLRVAVNGLEGTGKTMLVKKWVTHLQEQGQAAVHASIEGYHHPKAYRYRQGRNSAKGYYEDAYDEEAFIRGVLLPSQETPPRMVSAIHDLETDASLELQWTTLLSRAILITDGAYLFKPIYRPYWDLTIYLKTTPAIALQRGSERDTYLLGGIEAARAKFEQRYHKASQHYTQVCQPEAWADVVLDNTDLTNWIVLKKPLV